MRAGFTARFQLYSTIGLPAHICEAGLQERTVVIEVDSVEQAMVAHDSPDYQEALAALANGAERDIRIVDGA